MEKISQGESILLGYNPQSQRYSFVNNHNHPISSPRRNSDIDFSDVFGGPPRRASKQETNYSFNDSTSKLRCTNHVQGDDDDDDDDDDSKYVEKPVFGDELGGVNKRRYPTEDFFDDIFKGKDYSLSSSPRKHDRDLLSSYPGSRVLSPVRPLPPKSESFVGSSFPAQFSLPARLIKGTDLPAFGLGSHNQCKNKDGVSNCLSNYSFSPLSRISNQGNQVQEGLENNVYHQYYLSRQLSIKSEESSELAKPYEKENKRKLERQLSASDSDGPEFQNKGNQFHFSIYKWAGKGVPLAMPFRGGRSLGLKEKCKFERSSSYNRWINGDGLLKRTPKVTQHEPDFPSCNTNLSSPAVSLTVETDELKDGSFADTSLQGTEEKCHSIEEASVPKLELESSSNHPVIAEDNFSNILFKLTKEPEANDVAEVAFLERKAEALSSVIVESPKAELKQPHSLFFDNDREPAVDKAVKNEEQKGNKVKSNKDSSAVFNVGEGMNKGGDRSTIVGNVDVDKANLHGSSKNSGSNIEKNKVGGKVKEFVKIFNQEASCKAELDVESPRQDSKRKETGKLRTQDASNAISNIVDEKLRSPSKNNKTDAFIVVDEYLKKSEKQQPKARPNNYSTNFTPGSKGSPAPIVDSSEKTSESAPAGLEETLGDTDEFFDVQVEELRHEDDKLPQLNASRNEVQVIDDKIRNWSRGKEWNIRSLLSTLQYVLWPESGWKPVPLVDIIEGNAVRRFYQKALLCLHPDKLQQKGATFHQKYIAEKVFDILQEAWNHFS